MSIKGIIFDLDGVIVHTDEMHFLAWKKIADEIGVVFNKEINNRLRGVSRLESLEIILEKFSGKLNNEEKEELAHQKNLHYRELLFSLTPKCVSAEVIETLNKLKQLGYKMAIGSSSKNAVFILTQIGLNNMFDVISDGNNITNSKPHPEVFIKAAMGLSLNPTECIVVEDAVAGVEAAKRANMQAIAIGDAALKNCADHNITSFNQILSLLA